MNMKFIAAIAFAAAVSTPALAASYYVVQDSTTKKCTVVDTKPTAASSVIVSPSGKVYATQDEAQAAIKTITVCESK